MPQLMVRQGHTQRADAAGAVRELRAAIEQPDPSAVLLFCSPAYDLVALGREIREAFPCPVIACTSSGQIGAGGYQRGGMSAASLAGGGLSVQTHLLAPLSRCRQEAARVGAVVRERLAWGPGSGRAVGLLVVDGLSMAEEALTVALYESLGGIPVVGGSAGDDLAFARTAVYWDGAFLQDAAVLAVLESARPFRTLRLHHFVPTDRKLVITASNPAARVVFEIDGRPAVEAYTGLLGLAPEALGPRTFAQNPLLLRIGTEHYVRSLHTANPDGSLTLFCTLAEGSVLSVGTEADPLTALEHGLQDAADAVRSADATGNSPFIIGFDCILRRLAFERAHLEGTVGALLAARGVFGFSTYGEQIDALHVNQTLTGVALGG